MIVDQKCGHLMKGDHKPRRDPAKTKVEDIVRREVCTMCGARYYTWRCKHCNGTGVEP